MATHSTRICLSGLTEFDRACAASYSRVSRLYTLALKGKIALVLGWRLGRPDRRELGKRGRAYRSCAHRRRDALLGRGRHQAVRALAVPFDLVAVALVTARCSLRPPEAHDRSRTTHRRKRGRARRGPSPLVDRYVLGALFMSGRRPLIKGYFRRCAGRGCGHVFGLVLRRIDSAGPDGVR